MGAQPDPRILGLAAQPDPRSGGLAGQPNPTFFYSFLGVAQHYWGWAVGLNTGGSF